MAAATAFGADTVMLGLVPPDARMVASLNVERARDSAFGQKILNEIKEEDSGFRQMVEQTGFDPRRDLRMVVMASTGKPGPDNALVVARGTFDVARLQTLAETKGAVASAYRGFQIWTPASKDGKAAEGAFAFIPDSEIAIFGGASVVKAALDAKLAGGTKLPAPLAAKVADWNGRTDAWFISTAALSEMGIGKTGDNAILPGGLTVDSIKEAAAGVRFVPVLEVSGDVLTRSAQDATALADVMRLLASMIRMNATKPGAEVAVAIADTLKVSVNGPSTLFSLTVPESAFDQILANREKRAARRAPTGKAASR
jgi:hypothetical protein